MSVGMIDNIGGSGGSSGSHIYYLGTGKSFNIAELFPNDYQNLTVDNFIAEVNSASCSSSKQISFKSGWAYFYPSGSFSLSKSYNASTGALTITVSISGGFSTSGGFDSASASGTANPKVYVVLGDIETT